jgi:hypothetical protein
MSGPGGTRSGGRRRWLVIVGGVVVVAVAAVAAFYIISGFFAANGTWYGPMRVKTPLVQSSVEVYMDLSTSPLGGISGKGQFCEPNPLGAPFTFEFSVSGQRDVRGNITLNAYYAIPLLLGIVFPLGPQLQLHGDVESATFHLKGGDANTPATLDMKHGAQAEFVTACKALSPLG